MKLYKLRKVVKFSTKNRSNQEVYGITIPNDVAIFYKDISFQVVKSGTCILLVSGASQTITIKDIENYHYEDCIV